MRYLLLLLVFLAAVRANSSLENARRAQLLLGSDLWSQVIRVENQARPSRYPRAVFALVFEFQRVLWFYTDTDGTQSFSLHYDDLAAEKADFAPLLRAIEPGFARWSVVSAGALAAAVPPARLSNGCFIESLALWRERNARGDVVAEPRLLSYYFEPGTRRSGHTVFSFREGTVVKLIDPAWPTEVEAMPLSLANDPLELARAHDGRGVWKARFLPLEDAKVPPTHIGALG